MDSSNFFNEKAMQELMERYKKGDIPNMNPNMGGMNPNMGGMNPNMGGMNPNMGGMNPNMGGMNPNMGGMNQNMEMFNMFFNQMMMNGGMPFIPPPFMNFQNMEQKGTEQFQQKPQQNQNNAENWTLIFERKYDYNKINVQINSEETVSSAFAKYRIKSTEGEIPLKFSFKGKQLDEKLSLAASGLKNNSIITVEKVEKIVSEPTPPGFYTLFFEREGGYQTISIQVESHKTVKEAIDRYKSKMGSIKDDQKVILIFNSKTLQENQTLVQAGLRDGSKILVVCTQNIVGA